MNTEDIKHFVINYLKSKESRSETLSTLLNCMDMVGADRLGGLGIHNVLTKMYEDGIISMELKGVIDPVSVWTLGSSSLVVSLNPLYDLLWTAKNKN